VSKQPCAVIGIGQTKHKKRRDDVSLPGLVREAAQRALDDAELSATFSHQEKLLREALGLGDRVEINPSGGALCANPVMAVGLARIAEAARAIRERGATRAVAHATSGQCLQQNLVCVLEGA